MIKSKHSFSFPTISGGNTPFLVNNLLANEKEIVARGTAAGEYVYKNAGASEKIMEYIKSEAFLREAN